MNAMLPVDIPTARKLRSGHVAFLRREQRIGLVAIALFLGGLTTWSVTTRLQGAVAAQGVLVVASETKRVQHPIGGVVSSILVREGEKVTPGETVMRLDDTTARANVQIIATQLDELQARSTRLEAERDDHAVMRQPTSTRPSPALLQAFATEQRLFEVRRAARERKNEQIRKRIAQLGDEIRGLRAQQGAKEREAAIIQTELAGVEDLYQRKLVQINRLSALQRDQASIEGHRGQLVASIAQSEGKIAELELQGIRDEEELRAEVMKELAEAQARRNEFAERLTAAEDQLNRLDIRAPNAGIVHQLAIHTVGGVLRAGDTAMSIVPDEDELQLGLRVTPADIDQIRTGQSVRVKLQAGQHNATPDLNGTVLRIGADAVRDDRRDMAYYDVRVGFSPAEMAKLGPLKPIAGMQAEAFVETSLRSPIDYLLKPFRDQVARTFRER